MSATTKRVIQVLLALGLITGSTVIPVMPARGAATVPAGFNESIYVSGFGSRLSTMEWSPDGRLFVSEKAGAVRVVKNGALLSQPFVTVPVDTTSERGLMGIAFDPGFATNRYVYVYYTNLATLKNRVSRFTQSATNPDVAQAGSELVILDNIPSDSGMHNSGALHFGPDGKLFVSVGDSGSGPNAQNLAILPGKILRINTNGTVPTDNPFFGQAGRRGEIWAYGLRNPFTFAFQPGTGRMFINDVGNATWEEVNEGIRGANYGWPACEGACSNPAFRNPIYAYNHASGPGKSITGAVFYNGANFPAMYANDYFFGDYVGNYIKRYDVETGQVVDFASNTPYPVDLRVGPDGALYYVSVENRRISRIAYGAAPPPLPGEGQLILTPIADDHTSSSQPARNFGRSPALYVNSTNPTDNAFLKWDLTSLAGKAVTSARLRFRTVAEQWSGSNATQAFRLVQDTSWSETALNHNTRPPMSTQLGTITSTVPNTAYEVSLVAGPIESTLGGLFAMGVESVGPNDNLYFYSRDDATRRPQLVIDYTTPPPDPVGDPPVPTIDAPVAGTLFRAAEQVAFAGSATDPEDGPLGAGAFEWEVNFHHDTHTHPFLEPVSGINGGTLDLPDTGEASANIWYRIHLRATDSDGNTAEVTRDIHPRTTTVTLETVPAGLTLYLDGSPVTAPHSFLGVESFRRQLTAPASQILNGRTYDFVSWSDGGAADHGIQTPGPDTTYRATYAEGTGPVTVTLNPVADDHVSSKDPNRNYGGSTSLWVVQGESYPYLKFDLTSLAGRTIDSATLRVRTANDSFAGSPNTVRFVVVDNTTWGERSLTFNNRPPFSTSVLGSSTMPASNTLYETVLNAAFVQAKAGGLFSIGVDSNGVDSMAFVSREGTPKPELIITYH